MTSKEQIKALILIGGKSSRMQQDKSSLTYHQKPQLQHLYELLTKQKIETFISAREEQISEMQIENLPILVDIYPSIGPISGILSAFHSSPSCNWLVVAIDMPFISGDSIKELLQNFNSDKIATAFYNREKEWVEPLFAIYSSKAYPLLLEYFQNGKKCPRKFLNDKELVTMTPTDPRELENANTPDDFLRIKQELQSKKKGNEHYN